MMTQPSDAQHSFILPLFQGSIAQCFRTWTNHMTLTSAKVWEILWKTSMHLLLFLKIACCLYNDSYGFHLDFALPFFLQKDFHMCYLNPTIHSSHCSQSDLFWKKKKSIWFYHLSLNPSFTSCCHQNKFQIPLHGIRRPTAADPHLPLYLTHCWLLAATLVFFLFLEFASISGALYLLVFMLKMLSGKMSVWLAPWHLKSVSAELINLHGLGNTVILQMCLLTFKHNI